MITLFSIIHIFPTSLYVISTQGTLSGMKIRVIITRRTQQRYANEIKKSDKYALL